jgi:hypothetical protein
MLAIFVLPQDDLRLVCPTGGCRPLADWQSCNIARSATHTLVGRPGFDSTAAGRAAIAVLGNANVTMLAASRTISTSNTQVLFTNSALGMRTLTNQDIGAHLGSEAVSAFGAIRALQVRVPASCLDFRAFLQPGPIGLHSRPQLPLSKNL